MLFVISFGAFICFYVCPMQAAEQGEIYGWGNQKLLNGETLTDITQIAAGGDHNLALKSDGTIVGWGDNYYGKAKPPAGADYIAIAAGEGHSLAIRLVRGPVDMLQDLLEKVISFEISVENGLVEKLDTAIKLLEQDSKNCKGASINLLEAFIASVENFNGDKIAVEDADGLIGAARQIIELLTGE